jgi:uncharacterized protein (TIGR00304 family)
LADDFLFSIGFLLVLGGFAVGILAFFIAVLRSVKGSRSVRGGGVVMIGPIPIVFGTDKESSRIVMLLAIALTSLAVLLSLVPILWR